MAMQMHRARVPAGRAAVRTARPSVKAQAMPRWPVVYDYLRGKNLQTVTPEEADEMVKSGQWMLLDVRLADDHKKSHPAGAVSVPMYQAIDYSELNAQKIIKTIAYKFNGVNPVEPNPKFAEVLRELAGQGKGFITLCEAGGTMKPTTNFPEGKASRSLQAAYRIISEGISDQVVHLERGAYGWYQADLPFEGESEYKPDIGRTPMAAAEPTIQNIVASTGYEMKESDKALASEKKGWF